MSSATTIFPSLVSKVAVYFFAASMHVGGAFSNTVARSSLPSVFGHGVSPVTCLPGTVDSAGASSTKVVSLLSAGLSSPPPSWLIAKTSTSTAASIPP